MKKKTLVSIVAGLSLLGGSALGMDVPKKFQNPVQNAIHKMSRPINHKGGTYCLHRYDLDGDKQSDVDYLYPALVDKIGRTYHLTKGPKYIWMDLNGNKRQDYATEVFFDPTPDGDFSDAYLDSLEKATTN